MQLMQLMRLYTTGRGWPNASFASQITLFAVSLTLGVSLVIGVGSYVALRAQIEAAIQSDLAAEANRVEARLSHFIIQASAELETLSRNSFLSNGLVDSPGRDAYLLPFLRDFRLSIPGAENISLTLYDFSGKPLIRIRPNKATTVDAGQIRQAITTGQPQVRISTEDNRSYLELLQPIYFPPSQSVEGALVVRIQLAPLLAGIALAEGQVLQLRAAGVVMAQSGASRQDVLRVERALKLAAPFDTLGLRLTLGSSTRDAHGALHRLTLIYAVGLLLLLPLVGWLAHRSSRRLVAPLVRLSATTDAIGHNGAIAVPLKIGGPNEANEANEVGRLADAFDRMLARLGATQAELNHFKNTLDQALEAIFIFDPDTLRFTYVNEGAKRQTGYSQTELMQMTPVDIKKDMTLKKFRKVVQPLLAGMLPTLTFQAVHMHKNGHGTPVEIFLQLIRLESQAPRFVAMVTDVTERKQAQEEIFRLNADLEERVRQRTAQLQAANQELEAFSYSVAHDLRTPLSSIDGFSSLLGKEIRDVASERSRHYLNRIRASAVQMGELIDAMLMLAQLSRTTLVWQTLDLSAMAETVLNDCCEREPGRATQLDVQPGLVAQGDPRLLRQVLDNLLGNAWKFSGRQPQTRISFGRESGPDGQAVYAVRDQGAGFDMAYADKLFGAFQRLHTVSEFPGTGIGLVTVHRIITRHGGRIWTESVPGSGTTFYFTLGSASSADS